MKRLLALCLGLFAGAAQAAALPESEPVPGGVAEIGRASCRERV